MSIGASPQPLRSRDHTSPIYVAGRCLILLALFTAAAVYQAFHASASFNNDVWWHLRTGLWILTNHAIPRTGLFSRYSALAWIDPSWGYEAVLSTAYNLFGLRAIPMLLMVFRVALAVVTFLIALGWRGQFWRAILLSAAAQYVIVDLQPTPESISIILFGVELMLLLESRQPGKERLLWWLPLLFVFWANLHIQFALGLLALGWFLLAVSAEQVLRSMGVTWFSVRQPPMRLQTIGLATVASIIFAGINPYGFRLYGVVLKNAYSEVTFRYLAEMRNMSFRRPQHYAFLLLVMLAFFFLGRRRSKDFFQLGILVAGSLLAFRIQRDAWCVALPAIAILARTWGVEDFFPASPFRSARWKWEKVSLAVIVLAAFAGAASRIPNPAVMMEKLANAYPVKACDWIRANHPPQPLFNTYEWGGFLTWYLPEYPVAIDGRIGLYGNELTEQYFTVTGGGQRLEMDPAFSQSRTILLKRDSGMAQALTTLPALKPFYRVAYSDERAVFLVRQ